MTLPKVAVSWSSGKDAAYALGEIRRRGLYEVAGLLSTVTSPFGRVSMHGVRVALLEAQANSVGVPLFPVEIPYPCPNEEYERAMAEALERLRAAGIQAIVFGDLFLEDVRAYRERRLAGTGVRPLFPLWGRNTADLAHEMVRSGMEAYLVCVDPRVLPGRLAGRRFDERLLAELPPSVDPCGEKGEFHTFVARGPMFSHVISVRPGETVERDGFVFADLLPA